MIKFRNGIFTGFVSDCIRNLHTLENVIRTELYSLKKFIKILTSSNKKIRKSVIWCHQNHSESQSTEFALTKFKACPFICVEVFVAWFGKYFNYDVTLFLRPLKTSVNFGLHNSTCAISKQTVWSTEKNFLFLLIIKKYFTIERTAEQSR